MSSIGQTLAMVEDEEAPAAPRLKAGDRVRFVEPGRTPLLATFEVLRGDWAAIRDDDGNVWSARLDCLERVAETGELRS